MSELEGGVIIGKMAAAGKGASATGGVAKMTMSSVFFSGKGLGIGLGFGSLAPFVFGTLGGVATYLCWKNREKT